MKLRKEQYEQIAECFAKHRREAEIRDIEILNAVLYALENGCKWRGMPEKIRQMEYKIYVRLRR